MKNEETTIYKKVQYQESDFKGHYRLAFLISDLSNIATQNAIDIGIWNEELETQYGWILTKQTLRLYRPIQCNETIALSTRAGKSSRIQFTRLYDFMDDQGNVLGGVHSTWTFIDLQKRRITKPDKAGIVIPEIEEYKHAVEEYVEILDTVTMEEKAIRQVSYSDIDVNQHMNNSRYIEWGLDVMDHRLFDTHYISQISMLYKKEMAPDTQAKILYGQEDRYFKVQITSLDQQEMYFEMGGHLSLLERKE